MLPSNTDKKSLIESMKKLAYHISNNEERQREIFASLAPEDLRKIGTNLSDENEYLRRVSALLLCELLFKNNALKIQLTDKLNLPLSSGRISLGTIPAALLTSPSSLQKCLSLLKQEPDPAQAQAFCWVINLDRKNFEIELFPFKKYSSFTFLDPFRCLFGVTISQREPQSQDREDSKLKERGKIRSDIFSTPIRSSDKRIKEKSEEKYRLSGFSDRQGYEAQGEPNRESHLLNTERVKTESIWSGSPKLGQTIFSAKRYSIADKKFNLQPATSRQHERSRSRSREQIFSSNFRQSLKKGGTSIQSISQYARNSYGKKVELPNRARQSLSFQNNNLGDPGHMKSTELNFEEGRRSQKYNNQGSHHNNFYKRVQQILRK